jgi:hypothetical protein
VDVLYGEAMSVSDTLHRWKPRARAARVLETAPAEAVSPPERVTPLRKPPNFTPAVQRWSFQVPPGQTQFHMAVFGAEAPTLAALNTHPLHRWVKWALGTHTAGPTCFQHARSRTLHGTLTHVVSAYWVNEERFAAWESDPETETWWQAPERLQGELGGHPFVDSG